MRFRHDPTCLTNTTPYKLEVQFFFESSELNSPSEIPQKCHEGNC